MSLEIVGGVLGIATSLGGILGAGWKGYQTIRADLRDMVKALEPKVEENRIATQALTEAIGRIEPRITKIEYETQANGGKSMKDMLADVASDVAIERAARRAVLNEASFEVRVMPDGNITVLFVSPEWTRLTGLTKEDCQSDGWIRAVAPADKDRVSRLAEESMRDDRMMNTLYTIRNVNTKEERLVEHIGTPVRNWRGVTVGWVGVLRPAQS